MPTHPAAGRSRPRPAFAFLILTTFALGGCSGGDFGRVRQSAVSDDMHSWIGIEATGSIGLRASEFNLTDGEKAMRNLAYPLIEPPLSRPAWKNVFGDYTPLPAPWRQAPPFDRTTYGRMLIDEPHRSHTSRYHELMDAVRNDILRFEAFYGTAQRVVELDRKRNASLRLVSGLSPQEREDALARMDENALIIQWVEQCLARRVASYRWALERLVIHTPDALAASADMLIGKMASQTTVVAGAARPGARAGAVLK